MADKDKPTGDYEVGFGKPPISGQFKKGTSGNPAGAPSKRKRKPVDVIAILNESLEVKTSGGSKKMSAFEVGARQLVHRGLKQGTPDSKLVAVAVQGHQWFDEIRQGKAGSIAELAQRCGVDRTDVGRMIPFAFLAPDIVEAILKGCHPVELTAARLRRVRDLPVSWAEQRRLLEFTQ